MTFATILTFILLFTALVTAVAWASAHVTAAINNSTEVQKRIAAAQERSAEATEKLNSLIVSHYGEAPG